jgi:hypothetical protein
MRYVLFALITATLAIPTEAQYPVAISADSTVISEGVSMVRLIATPDRYHEKWVQVIGYLNLEFEGNAIYLHREDFESGDPKNGVWVNLKMNGPDDYKVFSGHYVIMVGALRYECSWTHGAICWHTE